MSLVCFFLTDVLYTPYVHTSNYEVITLLFAANIGRYVCRIVHDICKGSHHNLWWILVLHHIAAVICYLIIIYTHENLLMGLTVIFMQANTLWLDVRLVMKKGHVEKHENMYLWVVLLSCVTSFVTRLLLPLILMVWSLTRQNPLQMSPAALAGFFFGNTLCMLVNLWFVKLSVTTLTKCLQERKQFKLQAVLTDVSSSTSHPVANLNQTNTNNNFRYLLPVANANFNTNEINNKQSNKLMIRNILSYNTTADKMPSQTETNSV